MEENNSSLMRAYLGFQRLDTVAQTILLNQLWLYHNFFQPVMRLKEKVTDPITNRIKRLYTPPLPRSIGCARPVCFLPSRSSNYAN